MSSAERVQGQLFVFPGRLMFIGSGLQTDFHSHHASSLLVSLENEFNIAFSIDGAPSPHRGVVLQPWFHHRLLADTAEMIVIQVVPELYRIPSKSDFLELSEEAVDTILSLRRRHAPETCGAASRLIDHILASIEGSDRESDFVHPPLDPRITSSLEQIHNSMPDVVQVMELSANCGLSEHRFMHLFKEHVGIPVRRYILWARMQKAAFLLQDGGSLTDAAYGAGFSDSAHMSRTFKEMFGVSPSTVLGDRSAVNAQFCSELPGWHPSR